MRITGGSLRSRVIKCPKGVIRPAMDQMRESMFSILGPIDNLSFLDLFSGSGCIAIEAASRGAQPITLVEKDFGKKKTILENLTMVNCKTKLLMMAAEKYIKQCNTDFDIVHLDPPFPMSNKIKLLELANEYKILKKEGTLMMHYPSEDSFPEQIGDLRQYDHRKYGRSYLIFYTRD